MSGLKALGEFGLIDLLTRGLNDPDTVTQGIGDDCAVVEAGGETLLLSCDAFLEDIHFQRHWMAPEDIGYKAGASALSDIAAMGGLPLYALVTLAADKRNSLDFLRRVYTGMTTLFAESGCALIGGDTVSSKSGIMLNVTVIGKAEQGRVLYRKGVEKGDLLLVTGHPGSSASGLHGLLHGIDAPVTLVQAHKRPVPRLLEGRYLCQCKEVHAMIDISDGVSQDLMHLAKRSGVAMELQSEFFPLSAEQVAYGRSGGCSAQEAFLYGGEDYELALAVAADKAEALAQRFFQKFSLPLTIIGEAKAGEPHLCMDGAPLPVKGWDHFQPL